MNARWMVLPPWICRVNHLWNRTWNIFNLNRTKGRTKKIVNQVRVNNNYVLVFEIWFATILANSIYCRRYPINCCFHLNSICCIHTDKVVYTWNTCTFGHEVFLFQIHADHKYTHTQTTRGTFVEMKQFKCKCKVARIIVGSIVVHDDRDVCGRVEFESRAAEFWAVEW